VNGSGKQMGEVQDKLKLIEHAIKTYPGADVNLLSEIETIKTEINVLKVMLWGDWIKSRHEFETAPSISGRIGTVSYQLFSNTTDVTNTQRKNKEIAAEEYEIFRSKFDAVIKKITAIEAKLDAANIPYTKNKENWKEE
jgi:hypothetical protein